jgi:MoaA/NifB/PqqE/SkfB family radical SAM enzyme
MFPSLAFRILRTTDPRLLAKFVWNFGVKGLLSVEKFKRRIKRGEYFPPFLYLSILNSCNLRCQGCWVDVEAERTEIDLDTLNRTITDAKALERLLEPRGEPFMHPNC